MSGRARLQFRELAFLLVCYRPLAAACDRAIARDATALRVSGLLLAWVMSEEPSIPAHILHALRVGGDAEIVCQWLASEDNEEALTVAMAKAAITHELATEAKLRFVQLALTRGADPNRMCNVNTDPPKLSVCSTLCMVSTQATDLSPRLIDLLLRWGASADWLQARATFPLEDDRTEMHKYSPLACAILYASSYGTRHIAVAHALLRCGATLDDVATITVKDAEGTVVGNRYESIEWVLGEKERREPSLADKADYLALKAFLLSVRAAGGYRSFVIEQRRTCALVRHLALRDRATTRDGVLKFLARTGEQGLFRRVLSFMSPPPLPPPAATPHIRITWVETGEECWFQVKTTTTLMRMFRVYARRLGIPVARLAFSLPGSEVLIEGFQTAADISLVANGSLIHAMLYAEHPVGLREQAAAAAAAAAAAKEWLEDVWTEERFLDAENAEEAAARAAAAE